MRLDVVRATDCSRYYLYIYKKSETQLIVFVRVCFFFTTSFNVCTYIHDEPFFSVAIVCSFSTVHCLDSVFLHPRILRAHDDHFCHFWMVVSCRFWCSWFNSVHPYPSPSGCTICNSGATPCFFFFFCFLFISPECAPLAFSCRLAMLFLLLALLYKNTPVAQNANRRSRTNGLLFVRMDV